MRSFWIDTDTASDDAVAIVMALRNDTVKVEGISVVAGNVPRDQCAQNALYTVELCGMRTPVYCGRDKPIMRTLKDAVEIHGHDGMGDIGLPLTGREVTAGNGIDKMIACVCDNPERVRLVALGPLSNVATAILNEPRFAASVERCYIMGGGAMARGNVTPCAEYNMYTDAEAAHIVLESGMPITLVGWDVTVDAALITTERAEQICALGTPFATFALDIQAQVSVASSKRFGMEGFALPDPLAMAVAIDPSMATTEQHYIRVVTGDGLARGQTVVDHHRVWGRAPNAHLTTQVASEAFFALLMQSLR